MSKIENMEKGKVVGVDNELSYLDFSELSESEKSKAVMLLFNEKDYQFSVDIVNGKSVSFITVLKTGEKVNFIDYVKNN